MSCIRHRSGPDHEPGPAGVVVLRPVIATTIVRVEDPMPSAATTRAAVVAVPSLKPTRIPDAPSSRLHTLAPCATGSRLGAFEVLRVCEG